MTIMESMAPEAAITSIAFPYSTPPDCASSTTGFCTTPLDGTKPANPALTSSPRSGTRRPRNSQESAHSTPGPLAFVMMPTRSPAGSGWSVSSCAVPKSSASVAVRMMPAWWKSASSLTLAVATRIVDGRTRVPECEVVAARAPAAERPPLTARIGVVRATRRAMREKCRGSPKDSRYSITRLVSWSDSQYCRRSVAEMSALLPAETNAENPVACVRASSMTAVPRLPL